MRGAGVRTVRRTAPAASAAITPTEAAAPRATPEPSAGAVAAFAAVVTGMVAQLLPEPEGHRTAGTE
ncbi:hypothetical protein ACE1SV_57890 [Streptomyces sennicomposti]